jgi:hypothetical protein
MVIQYGSNPPNVHRFINGQLITDGTPPSNSGPEPKSDKKIKDRDEP